MLTSYWCHVQKLRQSQIMLQINVLSSSGVRQTAVSQEGTLQSLTVHWKGRYSLAKVPVGQLLFVSDWEISKADSMLLMTSLSRGRKLNLWSQCDFTSLWEKKKQQIFSDSEIICKMLHVH